MATLQLPRIAITTLEVEDLDAELRDKCHTKLGYISAARPRAEIYRLLTKINVRPFEAGAVERYKRIKALPPYFKTWAVFWSLIILVSLVSGVVTACVTHQVEWLNLWWPISLCPIFYVVYLSCTKRWYRYELKQYTMPVPEFALQTALDVFDLLAKAKINFELFVETMEVQERVYDPFLLLRVGGELFYLEVWNEPSFKAKRVDI